MMKLLPMDNDPRGTWLLSGAPPPAPAAPGTSVRIEAAFAGPLVFTGLHLGPDRRLGRRLGPDGITDVTTAGVWRVDEVTIDDDVVEDVVAALETSVRDQTDRSVIVVHGNFGVGSRVAIRATNVGDAASYFYATWELQECH